MIIFNAECAVDGSNSDWVEIDILVDGVAVGPSASDNAFCTGHTTGSGFADTWVSASTVVPMDFEPGNHTIEVLAFLGNAGTSWRIDDLSLTVMLQKR